MTRIAHTPSATLLGLQADPVTAEVTIFPAGAVEAPSRTAAVLETFDRVSAALQACGFAVPDGRYAFNVPGPVSTPQPQLDLPLSVAVLRASGQLQSSRADRFALAGELAMDGSVRPIRGAILIATAARNAGLDGIIVAAGNGREAAAVEGFDVRVAPTLRDVVLFLRGEGDLARGSDAPAAADAGSGDDDFADIKGQEHVKRALLVAVAGGHNVAMIGPPGAGKTMLAHWLPRILPPLTASEAMQLTAMYSVSGALPPGMGIISRRPFRNPHFTISDAGLIGGGSIPRAGEVSLAHLGVLFLDEVSEFRRNVLEALKAAIEDRQVTLTRAQASITYPCRFMLVVAMNPCPCGHHGDSMRRCTCAPRAIQRYLGRIPAPLMDRIDLHVEVPRVRYRDLADRRPGESTEVMRGCVRHARAVQEARFQGRTDVSTNAEMTTRDLREFCAIGEGADALLRTAITRLGLSARAYHRVLKVARTIADLDCGGDILTAHVSEAIQYRSLDRPYAAAQT